MKSMCCDAMRYHTSNHCPVHKSPFDCPDCLLAYDEKSNTYGIIIHDGGHSFVKINYCPWCGSALTPCQDQDAIRTVRDH